MTLTAPDPTARDNYDPQTPTAEVRATIDALVAPIFTGQRYVLLTLLEEQLRDLAPIHVMRLRDDVHDWMTQVRMDQAAGVHPKHNPRALHQVMILLD